MRGRERDRLEARLREQALSAGAAALEYARVRVVAQQFERVVGGRLRRALDGHVGRDGRTLHGYPSIRKHNRRNRIRNQYLHRVHNMDHAQWCNMDSERKYYTIRRLLCLQCIY